MQHSVKNVFNKNAQKEVEEKLLCRGTKEIKDTQIYWEKYTLLRMHPAKDAPWERKVEEYFPSKT